MKRTSLNVILLAIGLAISAGAGAQNMSVSEYKAAKTKISDDYKFGKAACASLSANPKDICIVDAKGTEKVARAELEARYAPSAKTVNAVRIAKAEAVYDVSKERCDDLAGNAKDVCVKEAKSVQTAAKADAKLQLKTTDANATAADKTAAARSTANVNIVDARKDASADKLAAQYKVAKEKCETFAGDAKASCLDQAKVNFGKP